MNFHHMLMSSYRNGAPYEIELPGSMARVTHGDSITVDFDPDGALRIQGGDNANFNGSWLVDAPVTGATSGFYMASFIQIPDYGGGAMQVNAQGILDDTGSWHVLEFGDPIWDGSYNFEVRIFDDVSARSEFKITVKDVENKMEPQEFWLTVRNDSF